uniref:Uncharacterized mitochondrial protein AtMg00810-like n=1 Tax=Tanacetum cinerariifolium TaxID=118510 RepID=A0A6L2JKK1_TANCI|nr:uncharacterized mitochondrial protein AtMg00810-like [Tanacetum cinerariifolium]
MVPLNNPVTNVLDYNKACIQFSIVLCVRFESNIKESHLTAMKRILRYLKGTPTLGLYYPKCLGFDLKEYSDLDYAGCNMDRQNTSGVYQILGGKLVRWSAKKQQLVAMSSAEAKYVAADGCCASILWMKSKLSDYDIHYKMVPIFCDNTSTIAISNNPVLDENYSSTEQVNSIQQLLAYCLITDEKFRFLPSILSYSNFTKDPSKVIDIELTSHMIVVNNQRDSVSPLPLHAKSKKGKSQTMTPTLPKPLGDNDSGGNIPPADMEQTHPTITDLSGTGAKYQKQHKEAAVFYADLKAFIKEYYDENVAHKDQTNKLVETTMSTIDRRITTIKDLYQGLNIITKLLKDINTAVKYNPAITKKIKEAIETFAKISTNTAEGLQESDEDPLKKLVLASTIVHPDPDEEVKVPYMINGKMCYLTDIEMQAYLDKEEKLKKAGKEARHLAISKPKVIKVVQEEAEKIRLDPKKITRAKAGASLKVFLLLTIWSSKSLNMGSSSRMYLVIRNSKGGMISKRLKWIILYRTEQMLLVMKDEAESNLNVKENNFMLNNSFGDETLEELTAVVITLARIQPDGKNTVTEPTYDAKVDSEVNASHKAHEQVNHVKRKTIIHASDGNQIDSNIIFDDPYVENNGGTYAHDSNDNDEYHNI